MRGADRRLNLRLEESLQSRAFCGPGPAGEGEGGGGVGAPRGACHGTLYLGPLQPRQRDWEAPSADSEGLGPGTLLFRALTPWPSAPAPSALPRARGGGGGSQPGQVACREARTPRVRALQRCHGRTCSACPLPEGPWGGSRPGHRHALCLLVTCASRKRLATSTGEDPRGWLGAGAGRGTRHFRKTVSEMAPPPRQQPAQPSWKRRFPWTRSLCPRPPG